MARAPILPTNHGDPMGTAPKVRQANDEFKRRIRLCRDAYLALLDQIEFTTYATNKQTFTYELIVDPHSLPEAGSPSQYRVTPNELTANAVRYEFRTLPSILAQLLDETSTLVDRIIGADSPRNWFTIGYVIPSYEKGTAAAWRNIGVQSTEYQALRPTLQSLLLSEPYQNRIGLIRAREFELMKGLASDVKMGLSQQLTAGLAQGIGPQQIARNITAQTGIEERRAERIARTEINQALRTARMDETQDASTRLGINVRVLHISALSPTTRATHAARSGQIFTVEQERDWFGEDANAINCKCTTSEVLVNDKGEPLSPGLIARLDRSREAWQEKNT
ncbi:NAD(+)--arginine ADP-ribosyltransferase EFV [compost metagenome]